MMMSPGSGVFVPCKTWDALIERLVMNFDANPDRIVGRRTGCIVPSCSVSVNETNAAQYGLPRASPTDDRNRSTSGPAFCPSSRVPTYDTAVSKCGLHCCEYETDEQDKSTVSNSKSNVPFTEFLDSVYVAKNDVIEQADRRDSYTDLGYAERQPRKLDELGQGKPESRERDCGNDQRYGRPFPMD